MTDPKDKPQAFGPQRLVRCVRTGQDYDLSTHAECPWCHGSQADLSTGDRSRFCGFEPGKDPVNFGFPPDSSRTQRG